MQAVIGTLLFAVTLFVGCYTTLTVTFIWAAVLILAAILRQKSEVELAAWSVVSAVLAAPIHLISNYLLVHEPQFGAILLQMKTLILR